VERIETTCELIAPATTDGGREEDEVSVQEMRQALSNAALGIEVLDVREPHEHQLGVVPNTLPRALSGLDQWAPELDPGRTYYLCCRSGVRSLRALIRLREHGFQSVKSVQGGLLAWAREIDPSLPVV
jgi:adenylyltransferase/sulfurtransferase